jgi:ABC-2 type transport system permease protein
MWVTSTSLLGEDYNSMTADGNLNFFLSGMRWLCEVGESSSVVNRELVSRLLGIRASDSRMWGILLVGVLPLCFIGTGVAVWLYRKNR